LKEPPASRGPPFDALQWQRENKGKVAEVIGNNPSDRFVKAVMFSPAPTMQCAEQLLHLHALDACHLSWGNATLYSAYSLNSNKNAVCLSHSIVFGNEDYESWKTFLTFVRRCYPTLNASHVTIVSDQDKGIKRAVEEVMSFASHFYCAKHRAENVKKHCKAACKDAFLETVNAMTMDELARCKQKYLTDPGISERHCQYLGNVDDDKQYPIANIILNKTKMYGRSTSSFIESMNEANRPIRKIKKLDAFNAILELLGLEMKRYLKICSAANATTHVLVRWAFDEYNHLLTKSSQLRLQVNVLDGNVYGEVRSSTTSFEVRLGGSNEPGGRFGTCSCGRPQFSEFPWIHMVCFANHQLFDVQLVVPLWCHTSTWKLQYPMDARHAVPSAASIKNKVADKNLRLPPIAPDCRGRPRQTCHRSSGEQWRSIRHCTMCFATDHDIQKCPDNPSNVNQHIV
ncbi:MAG: hypothetical protein ACRDL7_05345, partial [Gaiellaceae bacterium]